MSGDIRLMSEGQSLLLAIIAGFVAGFLLTITMENNRWRDGAVKHGHAEYYLDEKHERQWRWLPTPAPAK